MAQAPPQPGPGRVASLHLAARTGEPTFHVARARAVTGRGLAGDRNYWAGEGPRPRRRGTGRASGVCDVTLIEAEALEALAREHGITLTPPNAAATSSAATSGSTRWWTRSSGSAR